VRRDIPPVHPPKSVDLAQLRSHCSRAGRRLVELVRAGCIETPPTHVRMEESPWLAYALGELIVGRVLVVRHNGSGPGFGATARSPERQESYEFSKAVRNLCVIQTDREREASSAKAPRDVLAECSGAPGAHFVLRHVFVEAIHGWLRQLLPEMDTDLSLWRWEFSVVGATEPMYFAADYGAQTRRSLARISRQACRLLAPSHSHDFSSARWYRRAFTFNATQARCVRLLWEAWETGSPCVNEGTIGDGVGSTQATFRLRATFRSRQGIHPAWGAMIHHCGRGSYCLRSPSGGRPPEKPQKNP
jgi:hypothetical protein